MRQGVPMGKTFSIQLGFNKDLSTTTALTDPMFLDVGGNMVQVVEGQETHK